MKYLCYKNSSSGSWIVIQYLNLLLRNFDYLSATQRKSSEISNEWICYTKQRLQQKGWQHWPIIWFKYEQLMCLPQYTMDYYLQIWKGDTQILNIFSQTHLSFNLKAYSSAINPWNKFNIIEFFPAAWTCFSLLVPSIGAPHMHTSSDGIGVLDQ